MVVSLPLKWNDEVRAATRSPLILASTFSSSSARPSEKYSSSALALRFTNGSTAIEAMPLRAAFAGVGAPRSSRCRSRRSSFATSSAVWKRSRGFFSRQRPMMRSRSTGTSARTLVSDGGRSRRIAELTSARRGAGERARPGRQLVDQDAEREQIAARIDRLAADLLRRHVRHRAHDLPRAEIGFTVAAWVSAGSTSERGQLGETEVQHLDAALARHHHVRRFQIAVHHALLVRGDQGVGQRDRQVEHLRQRQSAGRDERGEIATVDQLHRQKARARHVLDGVQGDDVRMIERRDRLGFALEAGQAIRRRGHVLGQHLEGDVAAETRVARAVHLAHPARTERGDDLVDTETGAGRKTHYVESWEGDYTEPGKGRASLYAREKNGLLRIGKPETPINVDFADRAWTCASDDDRTERICALDSGRPDSW